MGGGGWAGVEVVVGGVGGVVELGGRVVEVWVGGWWPVWLGLP